MSDWTYTASARECACGHDESDHDREGCMVGWSGEESEVTCLCESFRYECDRIMGRLVQSSETAA